MINRPKPTKVRKFIINLKNIVYMYVIKKMRLNRFELRPCVSARALFASKGPQIAVETSKADSSCYDSPSLDGASKTKLLGLVDEMAKSAYAKHISAGKSPDMLGDDARDM